MEELQKEPEELNENLQYKRALQETTLFRIEIFKKRRKVEKQYFNIKICETWSIAVSIIF